ncbi:hypothetical protein L1987_63552 [Smallanthus sonchifolius]|uniref:Uncharacterized protein n=1 Tax=Smallanthus sonchifolius TaxID=185202 RepID=A0ACB9CDV4_9ASTR|nr:hypothetical protein L1987_63552 [Smallanthus sonchifolius]
MIFLGRKNIDVSRAFDHCNQSILYSYCFSITATFSLNFAATFQHGLHNDSVINKWIQRTKTEDLCYLFVDEQSDAIEAVANSKDEAYFNEKLKIQSCYIIAECIAKPARSYNPVVSHKASLRLGKIAVFTPVDNNKIPTYHFDFAPYNILEERTTKPRRLTDFIARVDELKPVENRSGKLLRKLTIQDESKNTIEITFWKEKLPELEDKPLLGNIVAITATFVTKYMEHIQMQSTDATTVTVNPPIPQLKDYQNRFSTIPRCVASGPSATMTLADILARNTSQNKQTRFITEAAITEIDDQHTWYYTKCKVCNKPAHLQHGHQPLFVCEDHKGPEEANIMYCVNATIVDQTLNANAVFFNEPMTMLLNIDCKDMVIKHQNTNPRVIPDKILAARGIMCSMNVTMKNDGKFVVNKLTKCQTLSPNTPDPKKPTKQKQLQLQLPPDDDVLPKKPRH